MEDFSEQQIKTLTSIVQRIVEVNNAVIFQEMDARFTASNTAMDARFKANNAVIFQEMDARFKTYDQTMDARFKTNNAVIFQEMDVRFTASNTAMDAKFETNNDMIFQAIADEGRSTRDFVEQKIQASEKCVTENILEGVNEMLDGSILPQIDDLDSRVRHADRRLTKLEAKTV